MGMPAETLDLLTLNMRLDMIDYYNVKDSVYSVPNTMEGLSHLVRPMTNDYIKVQITPVTTLTMRVLPLRKKQIVVSAYTVGDSLQAADSDLRFYDAAMNELRRDKFIKLASTVDFFDFEGVDRKTRRELLGLVPFPTVEYTPHPDNTSLTARLTVGEFLGRETLDKIEPYLRRERVYEWNGHRYEMKKMNKSGK